MKYILSLWVLLASLTGAYTQSCCCTGAGANYSILPNLNKHLVGLRYTYRNYFSEIRSINPEIDGRITNQHLHTLEFFGRFNLTERLQFSIFAPVTFIRQQSEVSKEKTSGLGDMSFLLQYNVLDPLRCSGKKSKHQLRIGAGTKLPSGDFKMDATDRFSTNLQLGSGSIDFIFNAIYTYRYNDFGFNSGASYKYNTANSRGYRFGDKLQGNINFFYLFKVKDVSFMPSIGLNYERQFCNSSNKKMLGYTGGDFLTTAVGFDVYYKQFAFSASVSPAVMNQLNWNGENKNRYNIEVGVFYNFSTYKN